MHCDAAASGIGSSGHPSISIASSKCRSRSLSASIPITMKHDVLSHVIIWLVCCVEAVLLVHPADGFSVNLLHNPRIYGAVYINNRATHRDIDTRYRACTSVRENRACMNLSNDKNSNESATTISPINSISRDMKSMPTKAIYFSILMTLCGATLGPFLDSYHSLFGVLTYNTPLMYPIIATSADDAALPLLACVTTYWVPPLFGLAGFIIGWLYIFLDAVFEVKKDDTILRSQLLPTFPKVLIGVSYFTFQYWLSGVLFANHTDRSLILILMSALAAGGFCVLDMTRSGFIVSTATAIGGPLIEIGLISFLPESWAYHYNDSGETGYFPLWIIPVYFLGGPANGNLARAIWNTLGQGENVAPSPDKMLSRSSCPACHGTRAVQCPNCDDGTYTTYGQQVICKACRGKGKVICRNCFSEYGDDPNDIENIRQIMDRIPY